MLFISVIKISTERRFSLSFLLLLLIVLSISKKHTTTTREEKHLTMAARSSKQEKMKKRSSSRKEIRKNWDRVLVTYISQSPPPPSFVSQFRVSTAIVGASFCPLHKLTLISSHFCFQFLLASFFCFAGKMAN